MTQPPPPASQQPTGEHDCTMPHLSPALTDDEHHALALTDDLTGLLHKIAGDSGDFTAVRSALAGMCKTCWRQDRHQYWCDAPDQPAPVLLADMGDWDDATGGDDLP